ncbi:hypothetical protein OBV_01910 [Oscillibacter valericigenes Sjm18-20]|nr:hypothetical protein OBV_01910 [Oscillibacter valericigenes Sjm18-20]
MKLRLSELHTDGNGCSLSENGALWKTPVTADANNREFYHNSRGEPNLSAQVKIAPSGPPPRCAQMWPTPTSMDAAGMDHNLRSDATPTRSILLSQKVAMFPTPKARDWRSASGKENRDSPDLNVVVKMLPTPTVADSYHSQNHTDKAGNPALCSLGGGQLNPTWVEWLMGFPLGWTDLNALETP